MELGRRRSGTRTLCASHSLEAAARNAEVQQGGSRAVGGGEPFPGLEEHTDLETVG